MERKRKLLESSDGESLENRTFEPEIGPKKKQKLNFCDMGKRKSSFSYGKSASKSEIISISIFLPANSILLWKVTFMAILK